MALPPPLDRVVAIVPVRSLEGSKSRLGGQLDAEEREALVAGLLVHTIRAARDAQAVTAVVVVSSDPAVRATAVAEGVAALPQSGSGLNGALQDGRAWAMGHDGSALLVLPADLPLIAADEVDALLRRAAASAREGDPLVALVPDRHGTGTNALIVAPPAAIPFAFGHASRRRHEEAARHAGARFVEIDGPLTTDLDTPDDLLLVDFESLAHEAPQPADSRDTVAGQPRLDRPGPPTAPASIGQLGVLALEGIPEIRPGDDLPSIVADAVERTTGVLPFQPGDVVVVTQKIVSKAEGAIVDLTTIEPRTEAVEFGRRWDRDPRQVEVVLREARRVIRMTRGVIITETPQGFVCANGGVDASNVGPKRAPSSRCSRRTRMLPPTAIRDCLRRRFGSDCRAS
jgi:2-phospho-L-lactate guanylyltransferase